MENSVYKIAFVSDMVFDLCVNKTMLLSPEKFITEEDRDWFDMRLSEVQGMVRQTIAFLLAADDGVCCGELCFSVYHKYRLHQTLLPVKIETAMVAIICDMWLGEYLGVVSETGKNALAELKSVALRQDGKFKRNSNL
ncbi:MAG: hypothetical protein RR550_00060 [Rikenellaceae bacterium]